MNISVAYEFLPRTPTVRASQVVDHFGISFDQERHVIAEHLELPIEPGHVVLFTGPSGSGKSSLLRAAVKALRQDLSDIPSAVLILDELPLGDGLLIDQLPVESTAAMQILAQCGLGEARLMLRRPGELSDGQRARFRLALAIARRPAWIVADEFTATLDRTLARVIAFSVQRLARQFGVGFLLATTHEDIAEDLGADLHVRCDLDGRITVAPGARGVQPGSEEPAHETAGPGGRKKKESALLTNCGSVRVPAATGRTSLGGITAATSSR